MISKRISRTLIAVSAVMLSSCAPPTKSPSPCGDITMTYKYPGEGSIGDRYRSGRWWRINSQNAPEAVTQNSKSTVANSVETTFPLINCSRDGFACVRTYQRVFAVPRGEFNSGAKYTVEGASISMEGCLRDADGECKTALFISDCRSADGAAQDRAQAGKVVGRDCRATGWGQQIMFIADRDRGVIAYESADWWKPGTDVSRWDLSTLGKSAGLLALVETHGLLSCEMSSSK